MPGKKSKILILVDWFEPGFKAGGPIRSCVNFVQQMKDDYDVYVLTTDRDLDSSEPYNGIQINQWIEKDGFHICYLSPGKLSFKEIRKKVKRTDPDIIYMNSMFSLYFTIYPLLILKLERAERKLILAPRGMLKDSALQFNPSKKKLFLFIFRFLGLHRSIRFHATGNDESEEIKNTFGGKTDVVTVPNFPGYINEYPGPANKSAGEIRILFVGRIHRIKNLDYLLELLPKLEGKITLTIIGGEEDKVYLDECRSIIKTYKSNIQVSFAGEVPNHLIPEIMLAQHIFALPTRGENFGHAIFEALRSGKPVLISDQTPWRELTIQKAGWDYSLKDQQKYINALQQAISFDQAEYTDWSISAWNYVKKSIEQSDLKNRYLNLLN